MSIEGAKNIESLQKIFQGIEDLSSKNPELPEFIALAKEASDRFYGAMRARDMPDGWGKFTDAFDELKALYTRAMTLRASQLPVAIGRAMGVPPQDIESSLLALIDPIKDTGLIPSDVEALKRMARGLGVDTAAILSGANTPNNCYYKRSGNDIIVRLGTVAQDEQLLAELRRDVLPSVSALEPILAQLEAGLYQLRTYNPVRTQMFDWTVNFENTKHKMDSKPLRLLGLVAGGLLSGIGLATNLVTRSPVTWPTFAWAGIAAYSLYPDFMKGNGGRERAFIAQFTDPKMKKIMGSFNMQAFEELRAIGKNPATKKLIKQFAQSTSPLSAAQIGALTGGNDTPLAKALNALTTNGMAQYALRTFGQRSFTSGEMEALGVLMKQA